MSFSSAIRNRYEKQDQATVSEPSQAITINQAHVIISETKVRNEQSEMEEANILYGFLENRYAQMVRVHVFRYRFSECLRY